MKSLLDPTFKYTSAVDTDISKTFARARKAMKAAAARTPQEAADKARVALIFNTRRIAK